MAVRDLHGSYKPGDVSDDEIRTELDSMEHDPKLNTKLSFERDEGLSLQLMTFQEKHLAYLEKHPKVDPIGYLSNLRAMIKIRK
jgi:hypothetical protein